jgi:hypothetical protein
MLFVSSWEFHIPGSDRFQIGKEKSRTGTKTSCVTFLATTVRVAGGATAASPKSLIMMSYVVFLLMRIYPYQTRSPKSKATLAPLKSSRLKNAVGSVDKANSLSKLATICMLVHENLRHIA